MNKKYWLLMMFSAVLLVLAACGGESDEEGSEEDSGEAAGGDGWVENITLLTGGEAGVYFPLGVAMADIIDSSFDNVTATGVSSGASVSNAEQLNNGEAQLALVQNDIAFYGAEGANMFSETLDNYSGVFTIYPETIQLVTLADSGIDSVADLEGKRVAIGDMGSGTEANATQIIEAHDMTIDDVDAQYLDFADASTNLQDGNVDAAFVTAGTPTGAIQELSASADVKIVSFDEEAMNNLMEEYSYYTQVDIPADAYDNFDSTASTVAVQAMLIASNDIPEDQMYEMTKAIFENLDSMANAHVRGEELNLETAEDGMSIDLHPGVQRYYDEQ
ncbi:alkanesulfonate transporter substrate-binding subunit [Jeotgalicoccus aerolatus]|uniref:TRAP transporter TAXI family solute receptor n=1 Tax=Jeotgalicoccus aerolatus TaxID=709510 RepID=A0ABS4HNI6_9STAP|nr:TAXI family TRAP transporter solute-binding subunit [Jeotgalicoccus aerolatus]MBP1952378.1 TRAP transporter TAXI family solute receptor [Jeotgalicoccus aerolatus]NMA80393.1 TAXI family TRAP transporter solute-binding subunit [Jeotgalicoccus aerolatus]CAD2072703.1 alkanesulfonate transporter substrate-binding subunit [Jeotgalicoccus aerolatus]GGE03809.1 C4-dicarboxylate ABC transporter substrate-binding protein [Jeotgalicoccus aerolatus]HJG33411.1 TAXI family TRAP transporter solute-binding 